MDIQDKLSRIKEMSEDMYSSENHAVFVKVKVSEIHNFNKFLDKHGIIVKQSQDARINQHKLTETEKIIFSDGRKLLFPTIFILIL